MDAYITYRVMGALAPRIPVGWGYAIANWLADLGCRRGNQALRGLRDNIRHALGPSASAAQIDETTRRAYRTLLQNYFDLFRMPALTNEQLRAIVEVVGAEVVESARALGRGVLLCMAHWGHPEAAMQIAATYGLPILGPAEHIRPERAYHYLTRLRTRHGLRLIPSDGPLWELFRALRRGEALGLALDRDTTGSGVEVGLCGERAHVPDGYARLAAKTRAPVVIALCRRLPGGRARLELGPAFVPDRAAERDEVYHAALDLGVRALERAVSAHPDQWGLTTPLWISDF